MIRMLFHLQINKANNLIKYFFDNKYSDSSFFKLLLQCYFAWVTFQMINILQYSIQYMSSYLIVAQPINLTLNCGFLKSLPLKRFSSLFFKVAQNVTVTNDFKQNTYCTKNIWKIFFSLLLSLSSTSFCVAVGFS